MSRIGRFLALLTMLAAAGVARAEIAPGRVVVAFDGPGPAARFLRDRAAPLGLTRHHTVRFLDAEILTVPVGQEAAWAGRLAAEPGVRYALPEVRVHAAIQPNDPAFAGQWNLRTREGATGADTLEQPNEAESMWNWCRDTGDMIIGVLDSGVDLTNPDLRPNLFVRPPEPADGRDNDGNGHVDDTLGWNFIADNNDVQDDFGHGTAISGSLGAAGNNGIGMTGVLWKTQMLEVKVLDYQGLGTSGSVADGIMYAVNAGARILNLSLSSLGEDDSLMHDALLYAKHHGVLAIVAAGNNRLDIGVTPAYPAAYTDLDNVVAVASSGHMGELAPSSNYGDPVLLAAPGLDIVTAGLAGGYGPTSGTSIAAPQVTGAAALYWTLRPWETYRQVVDALAAGVRRLPGLDGRVASGGVLDMRRLAQEAFGDSFPPARITDLRVASRVARDVTLAWTAPGEDGSVGRAESYELIRLQGSAAFALPAPPRPGFGGRPDSLQLRGLPYGTTWSLALRAYDRVHNRSATSDTVTFTIGLPPAIALSSDSVAVLPRAGGTGQKRFKIYNRGQDLLLGTLAPFDSAAITWSPLPIDDTFHIAPGDSATINITVDATLLPAGVYVFTGRILSNDPATPEKDILIRVVVLPVTGALAVGAADSAGAPRPALPAVASGTSRMPHDFSLRLSGPSPSRVPVRFALGGAWQDGPALRLRVLDVTGRLVTAGVQVGAGAASWNGRRDSGETAPAGLYFLVVEGAGHRAVVRFVSL